MGTLPAAGIFAKYENGPKRCFSNTAAHEINSNALRKEMNDEITSAKDLEGHTVNYLQGTVTQYFWEKYAQAAGIDTDQVELVNSSDGASLLATGSVDAVATTSYSAAYFEGLELGTVLDISADYDVYTTFVATLSDSLLEEHPEVAVAMNKAFIRTYEAAVEDPQSLYDALASETLTAEYMSAAYTFDESLWYLNPEVFDETFDYYDDLNTWLYENGIIQNEVDTDSFIDTQYYYQAAQELEAQLDGAAAQIAHIRKGVFRQSRMPERKNING